MATRVMIDGQLFGPEGARISVFDRGFLYGDSVFETLRTYGGRLFGLDEHLARLARSAALVFIPLPLSLEALKLELGVALEAAQNAESYVRVMLTRGSGPLGLNPELAAGQSRILIVDALTPPPARLYDEGIAAVTYPSLRLTDATAAEGAKIGNYLISVLAMRQAALAGAAEALIVDGRGRVVEGASSNVFLLRGQRLVTPGVESGVLQGITRAEVLAAAQDLGIEVRFEAPLPSELLAADEVFITSSIREILPVVRVDGAAIRDGKPGPYTRALHARFRARVQAWRAAQPDAANRPA